MAVLISSDLNDAETLSLYDDVMLLSRRGSCGEQMDFDDCEGSREATLHLLAMRFKLDYSYNPTTRRASIRRPAAPVTKAMSQLEHHITIICPSAEAQDEECEEVGSSTAESTPASRLSKARPLPSDSQSLPPSGPGRLTPTSPALNVLARNKLVSNKFGADKDQRLLRQTLLESQASHPLSYRISSWNIFHAGIASRRPRGRRGPLSAKSRSEIKVLEGAGGACWRCRILRRKVRVDTRRCPPPLPRPIAQNS